MASAVDYPWMELCDPLLRDRRWGNTALRGCSQGALYGRRSKKVQHKKTLSTLLLRFFGGIRLLDFCCECDLSQCVSFLVKHCVARKPLSFSRVALVCGVAERVHLVQQGYCADSVTRLFSESFRLIL